MGTRGFVGFVVDGTEKIAYNHCDSYPDGLGSDVLTWLHNALVTHPAVIVEQARALRVIDGETEPTGDDFKRLKAFYNPNVGSRSARPTWYQLLRGTQGDPGAMLRAGAIEGAGDFPADSLFAEWGYVVDFDEQRLEAYEGFQKAPHDKGRFAGRPSRDPSTGYHPVALVASWPLDALPTHTEFLSALEGSDEEADAR